MCILLIKLNKQIICLNIHDVIAFDVTNSNGVIKKLIKKYQKQIR
jgi:hypothetical protein